MDEPRLRTLLDSALVAESPIRPVAENVLRAAVRRRRRRRVLGVAGGATVAALIVVAIPGVIRPLSAPPTGQQPAGKFTVYVRSIGAGTVTPITSGASTPGQPIWVGQGTGGMAITPNGKTIYVADYGGMVTPITTATNTPGTPIEVGKVPYGIAVTPDGKAAYVANVFSGTVTPIRTATNTPGTPIKVGRDRLRIAITPDGKTA
jgi:YVTN family beta-propeller protein